MPFNAKLVSGDTSPILLGSSEFHFRGGGRKHLGISIVSNSAVSTVIRRRFQISSDTRITATKVNVKMFYILRHRKFPNSFGTSIFSLLSSQELLRSSDSQRVPLLEPGVDDAI